MHICISFIIENVYKFMFFRWWQKQNLQSCHAFPMKSGGIEKGGGLHEFVINRSAAFWFSVIKTRNDNK